MENKTEYYIERNSGWAKEIRGGQIVRLSAKTIIDFVAFDLSDFSEAFDQAPTKEENSSIYLREGHLMMSRTGRPLMTLIHDGFRDIGTHDLQFGMCGRARHQRAAAEGRLNEYLHGGDIQIPDHGCAENLTSALKPWGLKYTNIPSPVNFFQNMAIHSETGIMQRTQIRPEIPVNIDLLAEKDLLVAFSACPDMASKTGGLPVKVSILDS